MTDEALKIKLCILEKIKSKADLALEPTGEEIAEKKRKREALRKTLGEIDTRGRERNDTATQLLVPLSRTFLLGQLNALNFELLEEKKVRLYENDAVACEINFEDDLKNLLKKFKREYGTIVDFRDGKEGKRAFLRDSAAKRF